MGKAAERNLESHPRLAQCLLDLPPLVATFFSRMGATSDSDVAGAFVSTTEVAELGAELGWQRAVV